jgi:hypothetical protein
MFPRVTFFALALWLLELQGCSGGCTHDEIETCTDDVGKDGECEDMMACFSGCGCDELVCEVNEDAECEGPFKEMTFKDMLGGMNCDSHC